MTASGGVSETQRRGRTAHFTQHSEAEQRRLTGRTRWRCGSSFWELQQQQPFVHFSVFKSRGHRECGHICPQCTFPRSGMFSFTPTSVCDERLLWFPRFPLWSTDRRRADEAGRAGIIAVTMKLADSSRGDFLATSAGRASSEEGSSTHIDHRWFCRAKCSWSLKAAVQGNDNSLNHYWNTTESSSPLQRWAEPLWRRNKQGELLLCCVLLCTAVASEGKDVNDCTLCFVFVGHTTYLFEL